MELPSQRKENQRIPSAGRIPTKPPEKFIVLHRDYGDDIADLQNKDHAAWGYELDNNPIYREYK